jgi:hypothetical protein
MARGGHGLAKVSLGPAMPDPFTPWPGGLRPSSKLLDALRRTPMAEAVVADDDVAFYFQISFTKESK